jgi:ribonuclease Z
VIRVHILGSNAAAPAHNRHQTSQLIEIDNLHYLIDCGESVQLLLKKYGHKISRINHIFISHLHGDHYLGLMGLISTMHLQARNKPLQIYAQRGLQEIITLQLKYSNTHLAYPIFFKELDPEKAETILENEKLTVRSFPLNHRIPCCGFVIKEKPKGRRIIKEKTQGKLSVAQIAQLKKGLDVLDEQGNVLYAVADYTLPPKKASAYAFCSDTKYDEQIIPYIKQVDLLYHEATFTEQYSQRAAETFHSTAAQAAKIAQLAQVGKLLIGHFSIRYKNLEPLLNEASALFPNTALAEEGLHFDTLDEDEIGA